MTASAATIANSMRSSEATRRGRRSAGSEEAARIVPPAGRLSAPASWTTPLGPSRIDGVASAWITSISAITAKAVPITIAWPS
jgi:hypothetical protein